MRKLSGMMLMVLMALLLAACGSNGDDEDAQPVGETNDKAVETTLEPTAPNLPEEKVASTPGGVQESPEADLAGSATDADASPTAGDMSATPDMTASPVTEASPVADGSPESMESPSLVAPVSDSTPQAMASPVMATPAASGIGGIEDMDTMATPKASPAAMITLDGRVELSGNQNQAWVMSDSGCVGLGANADMEEGRQVIVRDETGSITGVAKLEATDEEEMCAWTFTTDVPESEFYEVTIPLKTQLVFTHDAIEESNGEITIILP